MSAVVRNTMFSSFSLQFRHLFLKSLDVPNALTLGGGDQGRLGRVPLRAEEGQRRPPPFSP